MDLENWFDNPEPMKEVDIVRLNALLEDFKKQDDKVEGLKEAIKPETEKLGKMEAKLITLFNDLKLTSFKSPHGTAVLTTKFSVKVPKTEEDKEKLIKWLEEKQIALQYLTVNSNSLNSLYKSFLEVEGVDFKLPGVEDPTSYQTFSLRSK